MSQVQISTDEYHYKTHKLHLPHAEVMRIFREECCELLDLDSKGFGVNGKLTMELQLEQLEEGSPSYPIQKWKAHIKITERLGE